MNKEKLDKFIEKYSLGGEIESVKLVSNDEELSVDIVSDDKALRGEVTVKDDKFPNGEFGIYTTSQLKSMLGVLNSDIEISVLSEKGGTNTSLLFSDSGTQVQYMLTEIDVIPDVPDVKMLPEFNISIKLDENFISTFGKSKSALPNDIRTFTFISEEGESKIVLGYASINSNRISLNVNADVDGDVAPISFNSEYLKAILDSNKNAEESSMEISTDGLCRIEFKEGEFKTKYYIVESR